MGSAAVTVEAALAFTPASEVVPDTERPDLLRARTRPAGEGPGEGVEIHRCEVTDCVRQSDARFDLFEVGFDTVDLSPFTALQDVFAGVLEAGRITEAEGVAIRSALDGASLELSGGSRVRVAHIAEEGLIMRTGGPNGLKVTGPRTQGMNDHDAARSIHADQDVFGTPLAQVMDGRAPTLLRHDSPDGRNREASLMMLNLWVPLRQITRPLVLADGRSIQRRRHQLRYGLPTESFLERDDDQVVNDIWTFLHDPGQRWFMCSEMDHRRAYVFDTLSTAHGSCILPGEDVAERCYLTLEAAEEAVRAGDVRALSALLAAAGPIGMPETTTPALGRAIDEMVGLISLAADDPEGVCGAGAEAWSVRSERARRRVIRMSLEMRLVVSVGVRESEHGLT